MTADTQNPANVQGRKPIKKSVRFEVFKRDNFTCQYCGGTAPEVVLHIDHINPVAGGGDNDILNMVTSCEPCNLGKGAKTLDDRSAIARQREQLEALNERREQLEMMLSWREGLASLDDEYLGAIEEIFSDRTGCGLTDTGRGKVRQWLKRNSLADIIEALDASLDSYYKDGDPEDSGQNNHMAGRAFNMVPRVIAGKKRNADKPWMKDLYYIRGIIRNRCYCNDAKAIALLEEAYNAGVHVEDLKQLALSTKSWTTWHRTMADWIEDTHWIAPLEGEE